MSVLVVGKVNGDTAKFRQALVERSTEFAKIAEMAQTVGAIHHRFGIGDGFVQIIDEWETPQQFEAFFSNPDLQAFVSEVGGDTTVPPDITITEAVASSDQF